MPSDALALIVVVAGAGSAAVIDIRTHRVPNALTLSVACAGVALAASGVGPIGVVAALAGGLLGLLLMVPGHVLGATGAGDVKLLAAMGTLLGPTATVRAFLVAMIAGGALAVAVALRRGRLRLTIDRLTGLVTSPAAGASRIEAPQADNRFAYAPSIAIGAIVAGAFV